MTKHYEQRKEANGRYLAKFDEIRIRMPKEAGIKEAIAAHAESRGESVNAFILRAVELAIEVDNELKETYEERRRIVASTSYLGDNPRRTFDPSRRKKESSAE